MQLTLSATSRIYDGALLLVLREASLELNPGALNPADSLAARVLWSSDYIIRDLSGQTPSPRLFPTLRSGKWTSPTAVASRRVRNNIGLPVWFCKVFTTLTCVSPRGTENGSSVCCSTVVPVELASHPTLHGGAVSRCSYDEKGPVKRAPGIG